MGYFFGFELCVAAGDDDKRSGVLPGYLTDCLTTFFIGQFGYRTSIDHANVCFLSRSYFANAVLFENFSKCGGIGKIKFTAKCIVGRCFIFECMDVYHIQPVVMQNRKQRYSFRLKIPSHRFLIVVYEGTILQTMLYICRQMHK